MLFLFLWIDASVITRLEPDKFRSDALPHASCLWLNSILELDLQEQEKDYWLSLWSKFNNKFGICPFKIADEMDEMGYEVKFESKTDRVIRRGPRGEIIYISFQKRHKFDSGAVWAITGNPEQKFMLGGIFEWPEIKEEK
jgi:hypothetical protein